MHPQLTTLRWQEISWPIGSYGALLTLALGAGALLALFRGKRAGLEEGALISSLGITMASGFIGAFVCSIVVRYVQLGSLRAALAAPGIVFYGALIGGTAGLVVAARSFGMPVLVTLDAMLPAVPIAHALGRVGCFFGGCCYGAHSDLPWAVHYPGETIARHPWPLYEAACLLVLSVWFWKWRASLVPGRSAFTYLLVYACLRFALEPLRGDAVRGIFGYVSTSQLLSLCVIAASLSALAAARIGRDRETWT